MHLISDRNSRQYGKINHIVNNGQYSSQRSPASVSYTRHSRFHIRQNDSHHARRNIRCHHENSRPCTLPPRPCRGTLFPGQGSFKLAWSSRHRRVITNSQGESPENRSVINVSSVSGLHGNVGQINYAAAKAAVVGLTKTIAKEWGPFGVRANTIAYGLVHTRYDTHTPNLTVVAPDGI